MPAGRRAFEPTKVSAAQDPFAAAEMAAAVAAVDAMDDTFEAESWPEPAAEVATAEVAAEPPAEVATADASPAEATPEPAAAEVPEPAAQATAPEAASLMAPEEAPADASRPGDAATATTGAGERSAIEWPANDRLVSARAPKAGGTGPDDLEALRRALLAVAASEDPALTETATQEEPGGESDATVGAAAEFADQAEAPAAVVALPEVAAPKAAGPEGDDWDLSEANAEREALREAVAIVMDEDGDAGVEPANGRAGAVGANAPDEPVASAPPPARSDTTKPTTTEPQTPSAEAVPDATAPAAASAVQDPTPRKKGLFRRIRG
jgi:ribonuclease E